MGVKEVRVDPVGLTLIRGRGAKQRGLALRRGCEVGGAGLLAGDA